jgi:hypothetical protein
MKRFMNKKMLVVGVAVAVFLGVGGAAFAYFTTSGNGTGNAYTGTGATLSINQLTPTSSVLYDSVLSPLPGNSPSYGAEAYAFNEIGNEVNLASAGQTLSNVVVTMSSGTCETIVAGLCTTTPGDTFSEQITLTLYNPGSTPGTVGSAIAHDTQTFNIPFRPSYSPSHCTLGPYGVGEWYDATDATCYNSLATNITFAAANFNTSVTLPGTVIYGISYNTDHYGPVPTATAGSTNPADSLNVVFTTASENVTVGSDAIPGDIFINDYYPTNTNIFCTTVTPGTFMAAGNDCDAVSGTPPLYDIPAVEINASAGGFISLMPGGPAQPIDFSINNSSGSPAYVQSVTVAVNATLLGTEYPGCAASWFTVVQPTTPVDVTIPVGTTEYQPSGASISLINEPSSQDACEGATIPLTFTSN